MTHGTGRWETLANLAMHDVALDHDTVGTYALRYNVTDSSGNAATEQVRIIEVVPPPPDAAPLTPTDLTEQARTPQSSWTSPDDAEWYQIEITR